ncbi:MAG: hypothetical protein AB1585_05615 [Thermodesulfobacteriota bacterium]
MFPRALLIWLLMAVLAVLNGVARVSVITPYWGDQAGHLLSTLTGGIILFLTMYLFLPWIGPKSSRRIWQLGFFWLGLTVAFEFLAGHYLFGNPWEKLLADYNLFRGRVWVVILLLQLFGPMLAAKLRKI